jgi:hypothetical protein
MTSDDGIPFSLVVPDVPASSSSSNNTSDSDEELQQEETVPSSATVPTSNHKCTKSIVHLDWVGRQSIIFHVNLKHGGDACGVLQLSVVVYDPTGHKVVGKFDEYIKPPDNAFWSSHASDIHGLYSNDVRITLAGTIIEVWKRFVSFIEGFLDVGSKKGIIAAWGGQSCDCKWIFRVTEDTHHKELYIPRWCPYFMDPKKVVFPLQ